MEEFDRIRLEYDKFYNSLLKNGKLPMWSTQKGFWNASVSGEIFDAFNKLNLQKFRNFLDIGSGDGKVVLIASLFCKNAEGVEIDSFLHGKALEMKSRFKIKNAKFHNQDFFAHDFSKYDVLFSSPDAPMERGLEQKLLRELSGKLVVYGNVFHPSRLRKENEFSTKGTRIGVYSK